MSEAKATKATSPPQTAPGPGPTAYDPSANVLALVEAAVERLNDLRNAETRRLDDLREMEARHAHEVASLLAEFQEKLRDAEAKRIDAIRAVDVNAVAVASGRASDQASVLAAQVAQSADALRALVATTAATMAAQQSAASSEFAKRLSELERSKYEGAGKSTVTDPMLVEMLAEVKALRGTTSVASGKSAGISTSWTVLGAVVALLVGLITIGTFVFVQSRQIAAPAGARP